MIKMNFVLILICTFLTISSFGQRPGVKKEGAHQAEYNAVLQDGDAKDNVESNRNSPEADTVDADPDQYANTSGVDSETSSSGGSPGMPMEDANRPDGTNTMQRASLNIAGSPLPGREYTASQNEGSTSDNVNAAKPKREIKGNKKKR
jgi:hypothetical protein